MKKLFTVLMLGLLSGCCSSFGIQGDVDCGGSSSCYSTSSCASASCGSYGGGSTCSSCSHRYGNVESYCGRWGDPSACDNAYYGNISADQSHSNWL